MGALKSLVVGLGILIFLGMTLLAWGVYKKSTDADFRLFGAAPAADAGARPFGDVALSLPAGCSIVEVRPQGQRLYLRIGPAGACARIVVVDAVRGTVLGTIRGAP